MWALQETSRKGRPWRTFGYAGGLACACANDSKESMEKEQRNYGSVRKVSDIFPLVSARNSAMWFSSLPPLDDPALACYKNQAAVNGPARVRHEGDCAVLSHATRFSLIPEGYP